MAGIPFQCPDGSPLELNTIGQNGGNQQSAYPHLKAKKLNLSFYDVQMTIQEGRAAGPIKPFNISGSTDLKN